MSGQENQKREDCAEEHPKARMLFDALIEEYKQLHDATQGRLQRATSRGNVLITLAFAILAYTIGNKIDTLDLFIGAMASVFLYFTAVFDFERSIFYNIISYDRMREIEKEVNKICRHNAITFQTTIRQRMENYETIVDRNLFAMYTNPIILISKISRHAGVREIRSYGLYILILVWVFRMI